MTKTIQSVEKTRLLAHEVAPFHKIDALEPVSLEF
jgi:hypothetical protein